MRYRFIAPMRSSFDLKPQFLQVNRCIFLLWLGKIDFGYGDADETGIRVAMWVDVQKARALSARVFDLRYYRVNLSIIKYSRNFL